MDTRIDATQKHSNGASRLSRRLIELGEFAKREGITPQDVRKCAEIGILQLRSHKGKTFVVDMPVCSLENTDQIDTEVAEMLGLIRSPNHITSQQQTTSTPAAKSTAKQISKTFQPIRNLAAKFLQNAQRALSKTRNKTSIDEQSTRYGSRATSHPCPSIQPGSISKLVQEMLQRAEKIKEQDRKEIAQTQTAQPTTNVPQTSQKQSCQMTEELLTTINRQLDQLEKACPKPAEKLVSLPQNRTIKK
jgi:hypothetical protein